MPNLNLKNEILKIKENGPLVLGWNSISNNLKSVTKGYAVVFTNYTVKDNVHGQIIPTLVNQYCFLNGPKETSDAISIWSDGVNAYADIASIFDNLQEALMHYYISQKEGVLGESLIVDCSKKKYREISFKKAD